MSGGWADAAFLSRSTHSDAGNTSTFPIPTAHQLLSIHRVVTALPPDADSWGPLDETCHRLEIEEDCLPLFLKLGLERGANWRDKWFNAREGLRARGVDLTPTQHIQSEESSLAGGRGPKAGGFDLLKAKVASVSTAPRRATSTGPTQPTTAPSVPTQRRAASVPKGDASADRRANVGGQTTREFLVRARPDHGSSSDDYVGVPSLPTRHRNKPNYPLQSTPAAAHRPQPTSTPLVDSAISTVRAKKRSSFPPPQALTSTPALNSFIRSHAKPRPQAVTFQTSSLEEGREKSIQSVRLTTALESRADDFRRLSLLSSTWFTWQTNLSNLRLREQHLDQARGAVLLRWAFLKWRGKRGQLDELHERGALVLRAREDNLVVAAFGEWVAAVENKRRREWEKGLKAAWDAVRGRWKEQVGRECLAHWRELALESKAMRYRRDLLLLHALRKWRDKGAIVHELSLDAAQLDAHTTQRRALTHWRQIAPLLRTEREHTKKRNENLLWSCLDHWSRRYRQQQEEARLQPIADECFVHNRRLATLSAWRHRLQAVRDLEDKCDELTDKFGKRTEGTLFRRWLTEWTGRLVLNSRALKLQLRTLDAWRDSYEHITIDLEARRIAFASRTDTRILKVAYAKWDAAAVHQREEADLADELARQSRLRGSLAGWRKRLEGEEVKEEQAGVARRFFGQRRGWNAWVGAVAARRQARWLEAQKEKKMRAVLRTWLARLEQHRAEQAKTDHFRQAMDARLVRTSVERWTGVIVARREKEDIALSGYELRLVDGAFRRWTDVCARHVEDYALAESQKEVRADELKRRVFRTWLRSTRTATELSARLARFETERQTRLVSHCLDILRERSLAGREEEMRAFQKERIVFEAYEGWKARTRSLPAIQFANSHLKRRIWNAWTSQTTDPDQRRHAEEFDRRTALRPVLRAWRARTKDKLAKRSIRRFRAGQHQPIASSQMSSSVTSLASSTAPMLSPAPIRAYFRPSTNARTSPPPPPPPPAQGDATSGLAVRSRLSAEYYKAREVGRQSPKLEVAMLEREEDSEEEEEEGREVVGVSAVDEKRATLREAMRARLGRQS